MSCLKYYGRPSSILQPVFQWCLVLAGDGRLGRCCVPLLVCLPHVFPFISLAGLVLFIALGSILSLSPHYVVCSMCSYDYHQASV